MFELILDYLKNNPKQFFWIKIILAALGGFVFLALLINIPTSRPQSVQIVGLPQSYFSSFLSDDLVYYNGLAFVKYSPKNNSYSNMSKGARLPVISVINYVGESGALASFSGSFSATSMEKYSEERMLSTAAASVLSSLVWYVDFKTGEITPVESASVYNNAFYYDTQKSVAYYVAPETMPEETGEAALSYDLARKALYKFNPTDKTTSLVAHLPTYTSIVNYISPCDGYEVCIGYSTDADNKLVGYSEGKITDVLTAKSSIIPTNNKEKFILASSSTNFGDEGGDITIDHSNSPDTVSKINEYNLATKKTSSTRISLKNSINNIPLYNGSSLTIYSGVGDNNLLVTHRTPSIIGFSNISTSTNKVDQSKFPVRAKAYSDTDNSVLIETYDGSTIYVGGYKLPQKPKNPPTQLVQGCVATHGSEVEYTAMNSLYTLYVPMNDAFNNTVDQISQCILKNPANSFGYSFQVMGINPDSGRIVTD